MENKSALKSEGKARKAKVSVKSAVLSNPKKQIISYSHGVKPGNLPRAREQIVCCFWEIVRFCHLPFHFSHIHIHFSYLNSIDGKNHGVCQKIIIILGQMWLCFDYFGKFDGQKLKFPKHQSCWLWWKYSRNYLIKWTFKKLILENWTQLDYLIFLPMFFCLVSFLFCFWKLLLCFQPFWWKPEIGKICKSAACPPTSLQIYIFNILQNLKPFLFEGQWLDCDDCRSIPMKLAGLQIYINCFSNIPIFAASESQRQ